RKLRRAIRDERRVVVVRLVPVVRVADDVGRAALAVMTAAVRHERGAERVEIEAPLVAAAGGEDFELVAHGMITPDARADFLTFVVRRAGFADERMREDAVHAVKPAVGSPDEAVERLVRVLKTPAVEQHLRRA